MPVNQQFQIEHVRDFDFASKEYHTLYEHSDATVFQHPLWLDLMYKRLAPSLDAEPCVVTVRSNDDGRLLMVLPMVRSKYANLRCIEPIDFGICDYNALVVERHFADLLKSETKLRDRIGEALKPVDLVFFRKLREESDSFLNAFGSGNLADMGNNCYDVPLTAPYEDWRQSVLSSKLRKAMRRTERKLAEHGTVEFDVLKDEKSIREAMAVMRSQRADRYPDDLFQQDPYFAFYSQVAVDGAEAGLTETSVLRVGGVIAAVEFGLRKDGCYHFILCGIENATFAKHSPGMLMKDYVLAHRVAAGDTRADFTIGDEDYKLRYGATPKPLRYFARPESLMGTLALSAYTHGGFVKSLAKKAADFSKRKVA